MVAKINGAPAPWAPAHMIGVDIGGSKIAAALIGSDGIVTRRMRIATPPGGAAAIIEAVVRLVREVAGSEKPLAVGVGAPGVIDPKAGSVVAATDIVPGWAGAAVRDELEARLDLPVVVENDVRAMALGESVCGAGRGRQTVLFVSLGTGVGGAWVRDGAVVHGAHYAAGEIAHLLVPAMGAIPCGCGRSHHLEAVASGPAMEAAYAARTGRPPVGLDEIARRLRLGDQDAVAVIAEAAATLGRALAGLLAATDPDLVVIGGGASQIGDALLDPVRAALTAEALPSVRHTPIVLSALGGDAPLIGAALLATQHMGVQPQQRARSSGLTLQQFLDAVSGRLIVSCQAPDGHPLRDTTTMVRLAHAAVAGGAAAIRCGGYGGVADVRAIADAVPTPIIGLTKDGVEGVYITPTVGAALSLVEAGADVIAADATFRPRPDGSAFSDLVRTVHAAGRLVMADVATLEEGVEAARLGADIVATTLSGYTGPGGAPESPDLALVSALRTALPETPVIAEGRYHTPELAAEAIAHGATAVVVGGGITDPVAITARFRSAVERSRA